MKFSIITPTHKRAHLLARTIESVLNQTYTNWEMIIVNDSPEDTSYGALISSLTDTRIHYYKNDINRGVNHSRNFAMDHIAKDSDWIVFLDDDDYFAQDALQALHNLIISKPHIRWFVTNRAHANGKLVTHYPKNNTYYSYIWDRLILKRCKGDVTDCLESNLVKNIRYSKHIKQAEEWVFFYQISLKEKFYYHSHNSTLTDGYDEIFGLNFRKRTKKEQYDTLLKFIKEGKELGILYRPTFILYLCIRLVRLVIK